MTPGILFVPDRQRQSSCEVSILRSRNFGQACAGAQGVQKVWAAKFQTITLSSATCSDSKCNRGSHRLSAIIASDHVVRRSNYRLHSKASRSCGGAGIGVKHCRVPSAPKAAGRRNYAHRGLRCEACSATQTTRDDGPWWPCLARRPRCNSAL